MTMQPSRQPDCSLVRPRAKDTGEHAQAPALWKCEIINVCGFKVQSWLWSVIRQDKTNTLIKDFYFKCPHSPCPELSTQLDIVSLEFQNNVSEYPLSHFYPTPFHSIKGKGCETLNTGKKTVMIYKLYIWPCRKSKKKIWR